MSQSEPSNAVHRMIRRPYQIQPSSGTTVSTPAEGTKTNSEQRESEKRARRVLLVFTATAIAVSASSLLSVNMFPLISNDSVVYIEHSHDLFDEGFVVDGYRQFGYPAALWVVRTLSDVVGAEPLLAMTVLQRGLLVAAGLLAVKFWGWWATPLLLLLIAPMTIAYSNLILTEGLALPLALLLVFPFMRLMMLLRTGLHEERRQETLTLAILIVMMAIFLFSIRFTYAVFGLIPVAMVVASWRTSFRRWSVALLAGFVVLAGTIAVGVSLENQREFEVFNPSADRGFTSYYYAWNTVFSESANRVDPDLARFYDNGVIYAFERELTAQGVSYSAKEEAIHRETGAMLEAAEMSLLGSRVESMAWGLLGGRKHDIQIAVEGIVGSTRHDIDQWIHLNRFAIENGSDAFAREHNGGQIPEAVITNGIGKTLGFLDARTLLAVILPPALLVLVLGLRSSPTRLMGLTALGVVFGSTVGHGLIWADNFRFLIVSSVVGVGVAVAVAQLMWSRHRPSIHGAMFKLGEAAPEDAGAESRLATRP